MLFGSNLEVHHVLKVRIFQIDISVLRKDKITKIRPLYLNFLSLFYECGLIFLILQVFPPQMNTLNFIVRAKS